MICNSLPGQLPIGQVVKYMYVGLHLRTDRNETYVIYK